MASSEAFGAELAALIERYRAQIGVEELVEELDWTVECLRAEDRRRVREGRFRSKGLRK